MFRIRFGGEEISQVMADLGIHSGYTLRSWVQIYRQKIDELSALQRLIQAENL